MLHLSEVTTHALLKGLEFFGGQGIGFANDGNDVDAR